MCRIRVLPYLFSKSVRLLTQGLALDAHVTCHVTESRRHWSLVICYTPHLDLCFRSIPDASTAFRQFPLPSMPFHILPDYSPMTHHDYASLTHL